MKEGIAIYTEEYERRGFPIKGFLLKLIILLGLCFLLTWLLPKFTQAKIMNYKQAIKSNNPLENTSFKSSINQIKDVVFLYYTKESLPQNINDSEKMTVEDMIKKNLIKSLQSKENYDTSKSYIIITKLDQQEYLLKINLKTKEQEDYVLSQVGFYKYCPTQLCEKKTIEIRK